MHLNLPANIRCLDLSSSKTRKSFQPSKSRLGPTPSYRQFSCKALSGESPWATLDVAADADEKTIRRAYRKLALRHHPDRDPSPDAPLKFVAIHEAYSTLIRRGRGEEAGEQPADRAGWDFHDWYWSFMTKQRQAGKAGGAQPKQTLAEDGLNQQLMGLKRKAAARRGKTMAQHARPTARSQPWEAAETDAEVGAEETGDPPSCTQGNSQGSSHPTADILEPPVAQKDAAAAEEDSSPSRHITKPGGGSLSECFQGLMGNIIALPKTLNPRLRRHAHTATAASGPITLDRTPGQYVATGVQQAEARDASSSPAATQGASVGIKDAHAQEQGSTHFPSGAEAIPGSATEEASDSEPFKSDVNRGASGPSSTERARDEEGLMSQLAGLRRRSVLRSQG